MKKFSPLNPPKSLFSKNSSGNIIPSEPLSTATEFVSLLLVLFVFPQPLNHTVP